MTEVGAGRKGNMVFSCIRRGEKQSLTDGHAEETASCVLAALK